MANLVSRITSAGTYYAGGQFDEVSYNPTSGGTIAYSTASQLPNTNLLATSSDYNVITGGLWFKQNVSSSFTSATTAPDGSYTAQKLIEDNTTNIHIMQTSAYPVKFGPVTISVYAKAAGRTGIFFWMVDNNQSVGNINISLITGKVTVAGVSLGTDGIGYTVTPVGNGWWRLTITGYNSTSGGAIYLSTGILNDIGDSYNYSGNGTSGIYLWGAQIEYGMTATNYIPTDLIGPIARANTNLFAYTQNLANTYYWNNDRLTTLSSNELSPDGTYTASKYAYNIQYSYIGQGTTSANNIQLINGQPYTVSVYVKQNYPDVANAVSFAIVTNQITTNFYFDNPTNENIAANYGSYGATITKVQNGYYKCTTTFIANTVAVPYESISFWMGGYNGQDNTGVNTYLWGPQIQTGNIATAFIATDSKSQAINMFTTRTDSQGNILTIGSFDEVTYVTPSANGLVSGYGQLPINNKNLLPYSQTFNASVWNYTAISANVVNNIILAPDGSTTGTKLVSNTAAVSTYQGIATRQFNQPSAAILTFSIYAKAAEWNYLNVANDPAGGALFNLSTGKVASLSPNFTDAKIINVGNGWYRCITTCTSEMWGSIILQMANTIYISTMTGDGVSGIYIWGAQLEYGTGATKYAPNPNKNLFAGTESLTNYKPIDIYNTYPWVTSSANVVSTTDLDPNGNFTATKVSYGNQYTQIQTPSTGVPVTANTIYTISVSVKSTQQLFSIVTGNNAPYPSGSSQWAYYDLINNSAQWPGGSPLPTAITITPENNGYKRCTLSVQTDATANQMYVGFWMGGYGGALPANTMTLFGPQIEVGNTATQYTANTINLISSKIFQGGGIEVINEFDEVTWNPPIVTSGLVLNLDSFNPNSYNGTGNTWFDISGNNLRAQMGGGSGANTFPQFVINTNSFYSNSPLSTSNFYINYPNTVLDSTSISIEIWSNQVNYNAGNEYTNILSYRENYGVSGYRLGVNVNGSVIFWTNQTGGNFSLASNINTTGNTWYQTVVTYDLPTLTCKIYINGVLAGTQTSAVYNPPTGQQLSIQAVSDGITSMNGYYSIFRQYNKQLSQAEINQNYNALAYRYNI